LDAALDAAQARSAMLAAQDATTRAAREMAVSAGQLPDPVLRFSVNSVPIEGPMRFSLTEDFMTQRSVEWMQTYTAASKRQARSTRYQREAEASLSMRSVEKARVFTQTARAWFERYFQEQVLDLLRLQRKEANRVSEAVESGYRGGRSSQADVLAAHATVAAIDNRILEVRAELANADALLRRWVGEVADLPLGTPPDFHRTRLSEHQLSHQIDLHPDLGVMNARERAAQAELEVANQDKSADWSWSVMYGKRGSQFGDMISIGVSIPLQWDQALKQDREVAARMGQVERVRFEREEMRRAHLFEVQRLLASWQSNLTRLADYDKTLIPLAAERVTAIEASFRGGKASLDNVLEAQRMVSDTRMERLRIEKQTTTWWAELEFLIPQDLATQSDAPKPADSSTQEP